MDGKCTKNMGNTKKNFMWHSAYVALEMILPLITSPILSRTLGAEGVGMYSYLYSIVSYFVLIANLGMYKYGIREIAAVRDDQKKLNETFWEIWKLHAILSLGIGCCYFVFVLFFSKHTFYFMIMSAIYFGGVININWLFIGIEEFKKITIRDMSIKIIIFLLIVFFVRGKNSLMIYITINSLGSFVSNFIYWIMCKKYVKNIVVSYKKMFSHLKPMLILFIPVLLESLYENMDRVMLGIMHVKSEVGYYENANKALIARTIIFSVMTVLMPRMANLLSKKEYDTFHRLMRQSTGIILVLAAAFSFGTAAIAKEFSVIFWGKDFARCTNLIIIMAMAMPAVVLSREIREQYLIPAGRDREYLLSAAAGTFSNLLINLILIPGFGATGAAIATLLSEYVVLLVQMIVIRHELSFVYYIHGNEIYFVFGILMFIVVRRVGYIFGTHLFSLLLEILVGGVVFTMFCVLYWKLSGQYYYLDLIKSLGGKGK